jgi:hypothetical protein
MKTAVFFMRLTPEEKARWEARCAEQRISLAEAMRQGARLYLDELRDQAADESVATT